MKTMIVPGVVRDITQKEINDNRKFLDECDKKSIEELEKMLMAEKLNYVERMSVEITISNKSKEEYTEEQVFDEIYRQLDEEDYLRKNGTSKPYAN